MFFPGVQRKVAERRLHQLAGTGPEGRVAYLRRRRYRTYEGELVSTWSLGPVGRALVGEGGEGEGPEQELGTGVLEHAVGMSELYVRVFLANGRRRPEGLRWRAGAESALSFREARARADAAPSRIEPDAIVELPSAGRRLFLEYETGSHPVVSRKDRPGATSSKLARYVRYVTGKRPDGLTHDQAAHPDQLQPELVFVLTSAKRKRSIEELLRRERPPMPVRAMLLDELAAELAAAVGAASEAPASAAGEAPSPRTLSDKDVDALRTFYRETVVTLRQVRHRLRAMSEDRRPFAEPPYPSTVAEVERLLRLWSAAR